MKTKMLVALFFTASTLVFSQKKEIKEAEKLVSSSKFEDAKKKLSTLESQEATMEAKLKPQYYFVKAKALAGTGKDVPFSDLEAAVASYQAVIEFGASRYALQAQQSLQELSNAIVNAAVEDQNAEAYKKAAEKLYLGYRIRKSDTTYLYYAASNLVNAKEYDDALRYYEELKTMNYEGSETSFVAINTTSNKEEAFPSKKQRDLMVKTGEYKDPSEKVSPSKRAEIVRMIALIYVEQGKDEEAIKAIDEAKAANPDDVLLKQTEANLYYKLGNVAKYKELMEEIVANDPDNPDLYYNLGVSAGQLGDNEKAIAYYEKAIELKPNYVTAKLNLSSVLLADDAKIVEEMNGLGNSSADNKRFDVLKTKRLDAYKTAAPYLESALQDEPNDIDVVRTLKQIYGQLDDPKFDAMKAKLKELEEQR